MLVLIALSSTLKLINKIETILVTTFILALILNVLIIKARTMLCSYFIQVAVLVLIFYNTTNFLGMPHLYELSLDILLIGVLLVILTLYWHYIDAGSLFVKPLLPVSMLIAGFTGVYIGVSGIVRYLLLTVLDALCSLTLLKSSYNKASTLIRGFMFFLCIYSIPGTKLTQFSILAFAALHVVRNMALLDRISGVLQGRVLELLCLDILLKPFVVMYT